jgi:hypothetical protein
MTRYYQKSVRSVKGNVWHSDDESWLTFVIAEAIALVVPILDLDLGKPLNTLGGPSRQIR